MGCSKSNSVTFYVSPGVGNQVETLKKWFQLTSIHKNSMHYLSRWGPRTITLTISCSNSNFNTFNGSPGMRNQLEPQEERYQLTSSHKHSMHYLPREGGGGLRTMTLRISCSKSNSITFYGSPGMRNQVGTQKERS